MNIFHRSPREELRRQGVRELSRECDYRARLERYILTRDDDVVSFVVTDDEIMRTTDADAMLCEKIFQACNA